MNSRSVLALHTIIFILFVIGSISSLFLSFYFRDFFTSKFYLFIVVITPIILRYTWEKMNGCPFTVWENDLRHSEQLETYQESCLKHYSNKWLKVSIKNKTFDFILNLLLIFPILAILFATYL